MSLFPLLPLILRHTAWAPYPRSAGFDTDIGAFIESSAVSSTEGSMAHLFINNDAASRETFLPGQVFVFGGFMLRANSISHLEQVDSYAPGHQIRFGNLNYVADIRGDLIFEGFAVLAAALCPHQEVFSDPLLDPVQGLTLIPAPSLDPERVASSEDGSVRPSSSLPSWSSRPKT